MFVKGLENPVVFFEEDGKGGGGDPEPKHDAHLQQTIKERDEAKAKARDAEKTASELQAKLQEFEDAKKKESGEFQKLADEYKTKFEATQPELERLKGIETEHQKFIEARKQKLIEVIPEEKRDEWKDADLPTLEKVAPLFSTDVHKILGMDSSKSGKSSIKTDGLTWNDLSVEQLDEVKKNNPKEYDRLFSTKKQRIAI